MTKQSILNKLTVNSMLNSTNKSHLVIIGTIFMIVNTFIVLLLLDTQLITEYDKFIWNTQIVLLINGVCFCCFFIVLKYINFFTIKKLFILFIITHTLSLCVFIILNLGVDIDFYHTVIPVQNVLNGKIFTPYAPTWISDAWRMLPPMMLWWYTLNYLIYGLDVVIWRVVNLLLEIAIIYVMIQIFNENSKTKKGWSQENFKIGLSFYALSFMSIVPILLYANIIAFPVLMSLLGFLYFFRSKKNPKYIYYSVFFFMIATLTEYFAAIWILGIFIILFFRKNFTRLSFLIGEFVLLFGIITLPFLMNDLVGYMQRFFWQVNVFSTSSVGIIWAFNLSLFGWPQWINFIPTAIALILTILYLQRNYTKETSLKDLIVIICIFSFFTPQYSPWQYLWIFPLLCLNIMNSFRKFFIASLFFFGFFLFVIILFVTAYLTYPGPIYPDILNTFAMIFDGYMEPSGYFIVFRLVGQTIFQMGFLYIVFSSTKSKKLILGLLIPFIVYYTFNICVPATLMAS
ncbi:MAG: hypothetical protein ACTSQI_12480 [Candidatus Helarchaeota archaeon]